MEENKDKVFNLSEDKKQLEKEERLKKWMEKIHKTSKYNPFDSIENLEE